MKPRIAEFSKKIILNVKYLNVFDIKLQIVTRIRTGLWMMKITLNDINVKFVIV